MEIIITANEANQRLDRFLRKIFKPHSEISLWEIYAWIRNGTVIVNRTKKPQNYTLEVGDTVIWHQDKTPYSFAFQNLEASASDTTATDSNQTATAWNQTNSNQIDWGQTTHTSQTSHTLHNTASPKLPPLKTIEAMIIDQDDNRIAFNKPADMVMHPTQAQQWASIHEIMQYYLDKTHDLWSSPTFSPQFCYRLDKDTSWVVIAAKNYEALQFLTQHIRERKVKKEYFCVVTWHLHEATTITAPLREWYDPKFRKGKSFIDHAEGKNAESTLIPEQWWNHHELWPITLVRVGIKTWRMHQIRAHTASIGHPIIGDFMYGNPAANRIANKKLKLQRHLLHAYSYWFFDRFVHKKLYFQADLPQTFLQLFQ